MARSFLPVDRDQRFLLPVDMREWLAPDHLVWFIIEVVGRLDLSQLRSAYRLGDRGRRAYDPQMLLALLVYAYSQGMRSSRAIERACRSDAAYRVICGNWGRSPDHATICRFRQRHQEAIEDLFRQVVLLAREMGMGSLGILAIDGSKVGANASLGANRTEDWVRQELERIFREAEETDREEEAEFGDRAGDELPEELADPDRRAARLEEALAALGEPTSHQPEGKRRVNLTDPDSRAMSSAKEGFVQGYNCQLAVTADGVVAAAQVVNQAHDYGLLSGMLDEVGENLPPDDPKDPDVVVADAGYFDTDDLAPLEEDPQAPLLLVATQKAHKLPASAPLDPEAAWQEETERLDGQDREERARRAEVLRRWEAGELDYRQAASEMGVSAKQAYEVRKAWRQGGTDAIPVPKRRRPPRPPTSTIIRYRLESRLADPENRRLYQQRSHLAETPFAQIKHARRLRQFSRRGLSAVNAEFLFECLIHNLLRIQEAFGTPSPQPA